MENRALCECKSAKFAQLTQNKQIIGNQGLHYVGFKLSRYGFNLVITARNAKGADILVYDDKCESVKTIQVKSTTGRYAVNAGKSSVDGSMPQLICDYWIFVDLSYEIPRCFIFTRDEAQRLLERDGKVGKDGKLNWWLQPKNIYSDDFEDKWEKIIV